jgi:hypothetical protein
MIKALWKRDGIEVKEALETELEVVVKNGVKLGVILWRGFLVQYESFELQDTGCWQSVTRIRSVMFDT